MKAAVLGARSMLGEILAAQLKTEGIEVITFGRSASDDVFFDLSNPIDGVPTSVNVDVVFHCAASFENDSEMGIRSNLAVNAYSANAVSAMVVGLRATSFIYAGSLFSQPDVDPSGYTSYAFSKSLAEQIFEWKLRRDNIRFCSLRFSQLYDSFGRCCLHQPWFGRVIAYASRGQSMKMPASGGMRNFLHVEDAASIMIQSFKSTKMYGRHNILHPISMTMDRIASIAYETFSLGGCVIADESKVPFRAMNFPKPELEFFDRKSPISMEQGMKMIRDAGSAAVFGPMDLA